MPVRRIVYSERGKNYLLIGVPWRWVREAAPGPLIIDPTTNLTASDDTYLYGASNINNSQLFVGKYQCADKKRALIKFNVCGVGIPTNATILNAQMSLWYYAAEAGTPCGGSQVSTNGWVQAHRMLVPWNEAQATRDVRLTGVNWGAPYGAINGTDALATMESTVQAKQNETGTWKSWTLTNAVQYWLADPNTNHGVILWTPDENVDGYDMRFRSSEHTNKPKLEVVWSNQPKTVYFLKDHLGSVRATVLDSAGAPVVAYDDYDPWGYILEGRTQPTEWSATQGVGENKFTGKERDEEHNLNWDFFGARYYDAEIGRWMSVDPILGDSRLRTVKILQTENYYSLSPYQYSRNNPVNRIDTDGRFDTKFHIQLTQKAFKNKGYNLNAGIVAGKGNAYVDRVSNFLNNNQHGMRNLGQTREQAIVANQKFIASTIESAVLAAEKDPGKALTLLGQAQHTQQDIVRHDYFTMAEHIFEEKGKNIDLDKNPPESELETAQKGSEELITQFEKAIRDRHGDAAENILNALRNYQAPEQRRKKRENEDHH